MRYRPILAFLLCALFVTVCAIPRESEAQSEGFDGRPDEIALDASAGGGPSLAGTGFDYISPPTQTPRPFTHLLIRREGRVPEGAAITLFVRASTDGQSWSNWREVGHNDDLWQPSDGPDVEWSDTIDVGATARYWQVRGFYTPAPGGELPELRGVKVSSIDANAFTPGREDAAANGMAAGAAVAKPGVVSRTAWGCPDGQSSRVKPSYYPVNHLVVHHTADSNSLYPSEPNWAARVRAEWSFHTHTRGWGDVGYNYLIDPNGVVYEGRAGGDDAVAFHDKANYGSMGVVLIGTYSTVKPTSAAQNSLVRLLAWKAAQKNIDPLGRSYYYGCTLTSDCYKHNAGSIVANIAGHRQVLPGHTTCPGDQTVALLPDIRNRVKQMLSGGGGDNGDLQVDELESSFSRSNANWHDAGCGAGSHTYYTYATDNPAESTNSATWRPNIPTTGTYRVYAHIPQGCGLANPPYASARAKYRIDYAGGSAERTVDHNTPEEWVDLGSYPFSAGTGGSVTLSDLTGEPYSQRKVIFFDAIKWVPEIGESRAQLVGVSYEPANRTIASGELLRVSFTVKNTGSTTLRGQAPRVDPTAGGGLNGPDNGYVYDQDECFAGNPSGSYPAFPKESDRFRVMLGSPGWDAGHAGACNGATGDYPWRWGLNADLPPGQTQTIVGYVRFRAPGSYQLQAGVIQEYVKYHAQGMNATAVSVTNEKTAPDAAAYDDALRPLARVYQLGAIPDNFLARTANPTSIPRGEYRGSFVWDGSLIDWGGGGPLGVSDGFLVEQTRSFVAPASGQYTFRTTSDDGSWLWIDGQMVVSNSGLHGAADATGTINLSAGPHVVSFKYFERTGLAVAGYDMKLPGGNDFVRLPDGLGGGILRLGKTFAGNPTLVVAADDLGGSGISRIRWSWDGANWDESAGRLLNVGRLQNGTYRLRYQPIDSAGNQGEQRELSFTVNNQLNVNRTSLPAVMR